ncbi:hypothetical protein NF212_20435 [Parasalinivibrio latis]|uniref:hypothetical protein n=1 Tax=Parasalinivibrio latis TaxID=2952610 RepID=UPI0030E4CB2E
MKKLKKFSYGILSSMVALGMGVTQAVEINHDTIEHIYSDGTYNYDFYDGAPSLETHVANAGFGTDFIDLLSQDIMNFDDYINKKISNDLNLDPDKSIKITFKVKNTKRYYDGSWYTDYTWYTHYSKFYSYGDVAARRHHFETPSSSEHPYMVSHSWLLSSDNPTEQTNDFETLNAMNPEPGYDAYIKDLYGSKLGSHLVKLYQNAIRFGLEVAKRAAKSDASKQIATSALSGSAVLEKVDIYTWPSHNMFFLPHSPGGNTGLLFVMGMDQVFFEFNTESEYEAFFRNTDNHPLLKQQFSLYNLNDGVTYSGVNSALAGLNDGSWAISYVRQSARTGYTASQMGTELANALERDNVADADYSSYSNAERDFDVAMEILPAALGVAGIAVLPVGGALAEVLAVAGGVATTAVDSIDASLADRTEDKVKAIKNASLAAVLTAVPATISGAKLAKNITTRTFSLAEHEAIATISGSVAGETTNSIELTTFATNESEPVLTSQETTDPFSILKAKTNQELLLGVPKPTITPSQVDPRGLSYANRIRSAATTHRQNLAVLKPQVTHAYENLSDMAGSVIQGSPVGQPHFMKVNYAGKILTYDLQNEGAVFSSLQESFGVVDRANWKGVIENSIQNLPAGSSVQLGVNLADGLAINWAKSLGIPDTLFQINTGVADSMVAEVEFSHAFDGARTVKLSLTPTTGVKAGVTVGHFSMPIDNSWAGALAMPSLNAGYTRAFTSIATVSDSEFNSAFSALLDGNWNEDVLSKLHFEAVDKERAFEVALNASSNYAAPSTTFIVGPTSGGPSLSPTAGLKIRIPVVSSNSQLTKEVSASLGLGSSTDWQVFSSTASGNSTVSATALSDFATRVQQINSTFDISRQLETLAIERTIRPTNIFGAYTSEFSALGNTTRNKLLNEMLNKLRTASGAHYEMSKKYLSFTLTSNLTDDAVETLKGYYNSYRIQGLTDEAAREKVLKTALDILGDPKANTTKVITKAIGTEIKRHTKGASLPVPFVTKTYAGWSQFARNFDLGTVEL